MGRAKKEVVWVPMSWCTHKEIETLTFVCPKCGNVTKRSQERNPFSSITCKYCRTNFTLDYGYDIQHPDEINYPETKWTMHFPEDIDENKKRKLLNS
jgi:hypothetical protein